MFDPSHFPNKMEVTFSFIIVGISVIVTWIIMRLFISSDQLQISIPATVGLSLLIYILLLVGLQSIFNLFYKKWQKKNDRYI